MTGCQKFTKEEFLHAITSIREKTFRLRTIKLGFRLTGLWLINSKLITEDLINYDSYQRLSTPSTDSSGYTDFSTPKTTEKVHKLSLALNESDTQSSCYKNALAKIAKSAEMHTALVHTLQDELDWIPSPPLCSGIFNTAGLELFSFTKPA
jgi:hypothetical protein